MIFIAYICHCRTAQYPLQFWWHPWTHQGDHVLRTQQHRDHSFLSIHSVYVEIHLSVKKIRSPVYK
jgi:hypothetical protein